MVPVPKPVPKPAPVAAPPAVIEEFWAALLDKDTKRLIAAREIVYGDHLPPTPNRNAMRKALELALGQMLELWRAWCAQYGPETHQGGIQRDDKQKLAKDMDRDSVDRLLTRCGIPTPARPTNIPAQPQRTKERDGPGG